MMPFSQLVGSGSPQGTIVEVVEQRLRQVLGPLLDRIEVDERWYRDRHPDVEEAIRSGELHSARAHYVSAGYFEDRLPRHIAVDEEWYVAQNPDVAQAMRLGVFRQAQEHFEVSGFREGRLPRQGWSL